MMITLYYHIKTSITFWYKRYLNLNSLFNNNKLYQLN